MYGTRDGVVALSDRGFWLADGDFSTRDDAFDAARAVVGQRCGADGSERLAVIGDFVIPPADGVVSRGFQTLHFDFGLPLVPMVAQDVARYTALYIARSAAGVCATTRLVPLVPLLHQRGWPERCELLARFVAYGRTHGAWDDSRGYSEGSLARTIEAAVGAAPVLPSVKADPDFLCGMEFESLNAELAFFRRHGLHVEEVTIEVALRPGQLMVFDNLALAHGRRGRRQPGELHQRVFGHRQLSLVDQRALRERVLSAFSTSPPEVGAARDGDSDSAGATNRRPLTEPSVSLGLRAVKPPGTPFLGQSSP
jgi:Taurine catabolism dioxygenase TauD, TfdA family